MKQWVIIIFAANMLLSCGESLPESMDGAFLLGATGITESKNNTADTTPTINLPAECTSYTSISGDDRWINYNIGSGLCDQAVFTATPQWVRFTGTYTKIPEAAPATSMCDTHATGWLNTAHPTTVGSAETRTVCYHWSGNTCNWQNDIRVTNCETYYVYELIAPPVCSLRYCTTN